MVSTFLTNGFFGFFFDFWFDVEMVLKKYFF